MPGNNAFDSADTLTVVGLRTRAPIGVMTS
jgi:hypothetical protein